MATIGDSEWEKYVDEASGSVYFYNARTGKSSWEIPVGFISLQTSDVTQNCKATKWRECVDDASGAKYYYDEVNCVSRWDKPDDFLLEEKEEEVEEQKDEDNQESKNQDNEEQREETDGPELEAQEEKEKKKVESNEKEKEVECLSSDDDKSQSNEKEEEEVVKDNSAAAMTWVKYMDAASNKPYYFNTRTRKTQWEEPEDYDESVQPAILSTTSQVSVEYQAHLNRMRTESLARVSQQVLDPSGNLSKLNTILSGIDSKGPPATTIEDEEIAADAPRTAKAEWQQHIDAQTQRYYYHNAVTGATQWNEPDAPFISGLANWIPPEVPKSDATGTGKTVSGVSYVARAKFNRLTGKYEQLGGDDYWQNAGIAADRAGRQMSHFFDMTELEKNREEAVRRKEQLKRKNIDWKKIMAEKKAKKQKQKNEWLFTD
ncbi:unnamed protein product [Peronospora farinosa]|uniref:WW domain-containing protein n=1 Tax=Peronospora farinosa TaxID=134698 RepID=A0AAV0U4S3_9STRA|nr:unnamed protein product [Peronospora farinosa]CAI5729921.1 unnamed protein product [Peronospora farinosa]